MHTQIEELLEQWQKLTNAESDAITSGQWEAVLAAQQNKRSLQEQIDRVCAGFKMESSNFAVRISKLLEQERANQQALADKRRLAHHAFAQSESSLRHLRQLNRAYGADVGNQWQSYG